MESYKKTTVEDIEKIIKKSTNGIKTFRYFSKRDYSTIENHLISEVFYIDKEPVGYFHIEKENELYWFGIIVTDSFVGKGHSKKIINRAIQYAHEMKIDLTLSVDKDNIIAYNLYQKNNFRIVEEKEKYYIMEKKWQIR